MEFFPRKRKNPPAVIIVALIDVLIVVLIFLLVTTTFKQQPALKLTLPESSQAKTEGSSELAPVYVTIDKAGKIYIGQKDEPVTSEGLESRMRQLVTENPQVRFALEMDEGAPVGSFIKVMDASRAAGLKTPLNIPTRKKETK
ncbi:biopolymer transporter ExbD [bacterium]|nr:biopolymer transporter ExbD [bacterium]